MDYNILLQNMAKKYGNHAVKVFPDRDVALSYADIADYSLKAACFLKSKGLQKGDAFAIWMGNVPENIILMAASLRMGTILIPISIYESMESVTDICRECNCTLLFYDSQNKYIQEQVKSKSMPSGVHCMELSGHGEHTSLRLDFLADISSDEAMNCELSVEDVVMITYTSGSTGKKKGIRKAIRSYLGKNGFPRLYSFLLDVVNRFWPIRVFNLCPWYHNTGTTLQMVALSGAYFQEITTERYNPVQAADCLKKYKPNIWLGTATMLYRCCMSVSDNKICLPSFILSIGEALQYHVIDKLEEYPGVSVLCSGYGTTEAGSIAQIWYRFKHMSPGMRLIMYGLKKVGLQKRMYGIDDFREDARGSALGAINEGREVLIFDHEKQVALADGEVGEICVHTPMEMKGCLDDAAHEIYLKWQGTTYIKTGDLGYKQGDMLYLAGREKNMIIRSGENILPAEIEQIALAYPGVGAAIACGVPSEAYGEDICLCLEAEDGLNLEGLQNELKRKLPKYMYPRYFLLRDELPVNASGKTDVLRMKREAVEYVRSMDHIQ